MSAGQAVDVTSNPFSRRAVMALVLVGAALFLALLWMIGTGTGFGNTNDGEAHAGGRGLNGYAAMADYLERRGYATRKARNEGALNPEGLLVLTPPAAADGEEIDRLVSAHRYNGPTLVITPKWRASPPTNDQTEGGAQKGWVNLVGTQAPDWNGFLDDVGVTIGPVDANGQAAQWEGLGVSGALPDRKAMLWGKGGSLLPLVTERDGRGLAALVMDGGTYPDLEALARGRPSGEVEDEDLYPLVIVFEPDLVNNYGMASRSSAQLLDRLIPALEVEPGGAIVFDMTLNGFGRAQNLLTLAFTPPFLAATLCLLLAALVIGWRAFLRFGPALVPERAIAFGKRALVTNAAGLVRRTRRFHLLGGPYAERARARLALALALPRGLEPDRTDAAIDRAQETRAPDSQPFSKIVARLTAARRPHDLLKAARDLNALERKLTR